MCSIIGYLGKQYTAESIRPYFDRTVSRGPDMTRMLPIGQRGFLGFHRLSIMGLSEAGMQPFVRGDGAVVCNGEIYGFRPIKEALIAKGYSFQSDSDCEILLPLYEEKGVEMFKELDAEFAMILYDGKELIAARDPIGIRPLYYGYDADGAILFASEAKNLVGLCSKIMPFPPGHYYKDGKFTCYRDVSTPKCRCTDDLETACRNIHDKLVAGIEKRLDADAPVGFLLSGGLDSSLVCAVAARCSKKPIKTFSIGMDLDAIDLKYARQVADYIGADHTEVIITKEDVLEALPRWWRCWEPTILPPSAPPSVCIWCANISMSTPICGCCSPARFPTSSSATSIRILPPVQRNSRRRPKSASGSCTCTMCSGPTGALASILWRPEYPLGIWTLWSM